MVHKDDERYKLKILVITVSSTRNSKNDKSGKKLKEMFQEAGYAVKKVICKDDETEILQTYFCNISNDIFVFVGGTGPSRMDVTVDSIRRIASKEIVGFGELFRSESKERFAYLSGVSLFTRGQHQLYCVPGSPDAVQTALSTISSMINHVHHELIKE